MKSINKILSDSNLTPSERVILLVQNDVNTDQGKPELLSKADRNAISEGWTPKNNTEVREYNIYQKGWKFEGGLALDMQTQYLNTEIQVLKAGKMIEFALWAPLEQFKRVFDKVSKVNEDTTLENLLKNSGIEYDHLIHKLVMENLSEELKADLLALSPDFETDNSYFKEEEKLYNFLNNKEYLNKENKNELATLMLSGIKWSLVKLLKEKNLDVGYYLFTGYFAGMQIFKIAEKWAKDNKIEYKDDDELKKILSDKENLKEILHETVVNWIDEGLFTKDFIPIYKSEYTNTCNEIDTKKPHNEIFLEWLKIQNEQKKIILNLMDTGKLEIQERSTKIHDYLHASKVILGESIYNLESDLSFVTEYKKQIDELIYFAYLVEFIKNNEFVKSYRSLLSYKEIYRKLGEIYNVDLSYKLKAFTDQLESDFELLQRELNMIFEKIQEPLHINMDYKYVVDVFVEEMIFDEELQTPLNTEYIDRYNQEFEKIFNSVWKSLD